MDTVMDEDVEDSKVDTEVVDNGRHEEKQKGKVEELGDDKVEVVEGGKGRETRESRRKRKEREATGDAVEGGETKEERKKRRDEKEKHRTKDLDENEKRDHRERKESRRKKEKESKERKEHRHGSDRRGKDESKDLDPRDTSDRRGRREKRSERTASVDVESYSRGLEDLGRGSAVGSTQGKKEEPKLASELKSGYVDDEQEEGEILDEDNGAAKVWESGELSMKEESVKSKGVLIDGARSPKEPPPVSLLVGSKEEQRERDIEKVDVTAKSFQNGLHLMRGIAEAYDSESQASDERHTAGGDTRSENLDLEKDSDNGGAGCEGRESGLGKKSADKSEMKKRPMDPPEQRASEVNYKQHSKTGEMGPGQEDSRRSFLGMDNTDNEAPDEQIKKRHSRHSMSPTAEDGQATGRRGSDWRRRRSPTSDDKNGSLRDGQYRRRRSRSKETDNPTHIERARSPSLESARDRGSRRKRTHSPEVVRSRVGGRSRSREEDLERRTGADELDQKKRSRSPDDSYEYRHSRDNYDHHDRSRRSRSRESGRVRASSRADSVDRRRRSRSREMLKGRRIGSERDSTRRAESTERRRRSRSRESLHRRTEDREGSRHADVYDRSRGSRSAVVSRSYKADERDRRVEEVAYRSSRDDRHYRDSRHIENSKENMYRMDKDRERNGISSHDRVRGQRTPQSKDNQPSGKASSVGNTIEEEDQEEYQERVASQLAAQEEDDPEKIKEESRRRRQAILEKFKRQQQQQQKAAEGQLPTGTRNSDAQDHLPTQSNSEAGDAAAEKTESKPSEGQLTLGKGSLQNGALPKPTIDGALGAGSPKSERSADMFSDDIFGESPAGGRRLGKGDGLALDTSGLTDNWDDAEGYYCFRIGEILDGRYEVASSHGRGVFSTVVRARDHKAGRGEPEEVAIKIIRNNETMFKAGQQELVILKKLAGADPENKRHCVRLLSSFEYRSHLCLVFESLHMNLREILKKFGRNIGINLNAVRAYAKQLFIALKHLKNCGVLHCDIKPDNMLVNEAKNVLKLCDFGSAMFAGENEITPYLVSRFYRAPEIILGLPYDHALDIWSVGCCLYELYTGKMLFPGHTNNDMLRLHMELKGPFPKKMLKKAAFADQHFDQDFNFCAIEEDPVTKKTVKRILANVRPKDMGSLVSSSGSADEDPKLQASFKDLLEKVFILDPDKRLTHKGASTVGGEGEHWEQLLLVWRPFITGRYCQKIKHCSIGCIQVCSSNIGEFSTRWWQPFC
ncbi:hypothetical protein R1sor_007383 [Riccia sorocarpa]|uniref:Serine/threonine-protein kinase PRP4 homolog n=1 Tax=Riccia sorocarpa TaxID=122646 RepID=A0ABD3HTS7_9MARC